MIKELLSDVFGIAVSMVRGARDDVVLGGWFGAEANRSKSTQGEFGLNWFRDEQAQPERSSEPQSHEVEQANEQSREQDRGIER
jgi:hypothetical protein